MRYFSGFGFAGEEALFEDILCTSSFCVAGFSFGAIQAFEYALCANERIDTLQLISPAFFQHQPSKFKKLQLLGFLKDKAQYLKNFYTMASYPNQDDYSNFYAQTTKEDLETLLSYVWQKEQLKRLKSKGVVIEVFLGDEDKIIDAKEVLRFFEGLCDIYYIKNVGHILKENR